jgi:cation diffusion facilitator CzcD-associated flavoprotein CzcO
LAAENATTPLVPLAADTNTDWQDVAKSAGVDHHVKLSHRMLSAEWDADVGEYTITLLNQATGQQVITKARVLVSAIGGFHTPLVPKLKGQDKFRGKVIHCARWPKDLTPADLRGKKVAVIGNGCSG